MGKVKEFIIELAEEIVDQHLDTNFENMSQTDIYLKVADTVEKFIENSKAEIDRDEYNFFIENDEMIIVTIMNLIGHGDDLPGDIDILRGSSYRTYESVDEIYIEPLNERFEE